MLIFMRICEVVLTVLTGSYVTEDGRLKMQTEGISLKGGVNATIEDMHSKTIDVTFYGGTNVAGEGTSL